MRKQVSAHYATAGWILAGVFFFTYVCTMRRGCSDTPLQPSHVPQQPGCAVMGGSYMEIDARSAEERLIRNTLLTELWSGDDP